MLYLNSNNYVKLTELKNAATGDLVTGGTVKLVVQDINGNEVQGENWPVIMTGIVGNDGAYEATLSSDLTLVDDQEYKVVIEAVHAGMKLTGVYQTWAKPFSFN